MSAGLGKPAAESPRMVALSLGFSLVGRNSSPTWGELADIAAELYWQNRPQPSRAAFTEHRRRQQRESAPVEVWLRRAGAA